MVQRQTVQHSQLSERAKRWREEEGRKDAEEEGRQQGRQGDQDHRDPMISQSSRPSGESIQPSGFRVEGLGIKTVAIKQLLEVQHMLWNARRGGEKT